MKKLLLSSLLATSVSTVVLAQESTLGLTERRAVKEYQEKKYPAILKAIQTAAGYNIAIEVKWETIAKPGMTEFYEKDEYWGMVFFTPIEKTFERITVDAEGKTQLKNKLKKVIIMHDEKTAPAGDYERGLTWDNGVLTINFTPYTNATPSHMEYRIQAMQKFIEAKL